MSWRNSFRCLAKRYKCRSSESFTVNELWDGIFVATKDSFFQSQSQRGYLSSSLSPTGNPSEAFNYERNVPGRAKLPGFVTGLAQGTGPGAIVLSRQYGQRSGDGPDLSREFFVQLWLADEKKQRSGGLQKRKLRNTVDQRRTGFGSQTSSQVPFGKWFSGASIPEETSYNEVKPVLKQPPTSQSVTGILEPTSLEEVELSNPSTIHSKEMENFMFDIYESNMKLNFQVSTLIGLLAAKWPISYVFVASLNLNVHTV